MLENAYICFSPSPATHCNRPESYPRQKAKVILNRKVSSAAGLSPTVQAPLLRSLQAPLICCRCLSSAKGASPPLQVHLFRCRRLSSAAGTSPPLHASLVRCRHLSSAAGASPLLQASLIRCRRLSSSAGAFPLQAHPLRRRRLSPAAGVSCPL